MTCQDCQLCKHATNVCIDGDGPNALKNGVLIVGEAPEEIDDKVGKPFQGPAGKLLRDMVAIVIGKLEESEKEKIDLRKIRYTNAVRCYSAGANIDQGIEPCRWRLAEEICRTKPWRVIAFGDVAVKSLVGYPLSVMDVVGGWAHKTPICDSLVQFAIHPVLPLRSKPLLHYWRLTTARVLASKPSVNKLRSFDDCMIIPICERQTALNILKKAKGKKLVALDTEYNSKNNRLLCLAISWSSNVAYVFDDQVLRDSAVVSGFSDLIKNAGKMAAHNWKFDARVLVNTLGIDPGLMIHPDRWWLDTMTMRRLSNPEQHAALEVAEWMVGLGGAKEALKVLLQRGHPGVAYEKAYLADKDVVMRYCGGDALACFRLAKYYTRRLKADGIWEVWNDTFGPLGSVLWSMEEGGMPIDVDAMDDVEVALKDRIQLELNIIRSSASIKKLCANWEREITVNEFNPKSSQQMADFLFLSPYGLGLNPRSNDYTKNGAPSTDKNVIQLHAKADPALAHILEFNRLMTKLSSNINGYRKRLHYRGKRKRAFLRTNYKQGEVRTQRLSSSDPNLQNIPNKLGVYVEDKMIRQMFVPHLKGELDANKT